MIDLPAIADRCARFIVFAGDRRGVTDGNLAERIDAYRNLGAPERFRVQVLLCQHPDLAVTTEAIGFGMTAFRFYPRHNAPPDAHRTSRPGP